LVAPNSGITFFNVNYITTDRVDVDPRFTGPKLVDGFGETGTRFVPIPFQTNRVFTNLDFPTPNELGGDVTLVPDLLPAHARHSVAPKGEVLVVVRVAEQQAAGRLSHLGQRHSDLKAVVLRVRPRQSVSLPQHRAREDNRSPPGAEVIAVAHAPLIHSLWL